MFGSFVTSPNLRQMRTEFKQNEKKLEQEINEMLSLAQKIPKEEKLYRELVNNKNLIFESTDDLYHKYADLKNGNQILREQNMVLQKLYENIQKRIEENASIDTGILSESHRQQICNAVNDVFNLIENEYSYTDIDQLKAELEQVTNERHRLDDELQLYRKLYDDNEKPDSFDTIIEQISNGPECNDIYELMNYQSYPNFDEPPHIQEIHSSQNDSKATKSGQIIHDIQNQISQNNNITNYINSIYKDQRNFIRHCTEYASNSKNISKSLEQLEQKIEDAGEIGSIQISPLICPSETENMESNINPIEILAEDFKQMTENAISQLPTVTFFEDSVARAQQSLAINTDISTPPPNINSTQFGNDDLSELYLRLSALSNIDKKDNFQHTAATEKKEVENQENQINEKFEIPEIDNAKFDSLVEKVEEVLPENIAETLNKAQPQEESQQTQEDVLIEFEVTDSYRYRIKNFHEIVDKINSITFSQDAVLTRPQEIPVSVVNPDNVDIHGVVSNVDQLLSRTDADIEKEIDSIRQRTKQFRMKTEDIESQVDKEVEAMNDEISSLDAQINQSKKELSSTNGTSILIKKNVELLRSELSDITRQCDSIDVPKKSVSELENDINKTKRKIGSFHNIK